MGGAPKTVLTTTALSRTEFHCPAPAQTCHVDADLVSGRRLQRRQRGNEWCTGGWFAAGFHVLRLKMGHPDALCVCVCVRVWCLVYF